MLSRLHAVLARQAINIPAAEETHDSEGDLEISASTLTSPGTSGFLGFLGFQTLSQGDSVPRFEILYVFSAGQMARRDCVWKFESGAEVANKA
jgi:hypothetical protein